MTQPNQFSSNEAIDKAKDYAFAARTARPDLGHLSGFVKAGSS